MMRSSNSKIQGKVETVNSESRLANGLSSKEDEDDLGNVRQLAAKVVDDVVKKASETAERRTADHTTTPKKNRGCNIQKLPTIQIDTVPSPPPSPDELTPPDESNEIEEPVDESDIQLDLDTAQQETGNSSEDLKERLQSYVEDLLSQAMVIAEKKIQFAGLPEDDEDEEESQSEPAHRSSEPAQEPEPEIDESEIRATAEKVVQEVITKASETVAEKLENEVADLTFPIKFDEAPEDVKEVASSFVKEIVGKAITMAEEKSVPTVPFNFEDVDLMKTSGPWYIRAREALIRLLRTACFCTPRRTDS